MLFHADVFGTTDILSMAIQKVLGHVFDLAQCRTGEVRLNQLRPALLALGKPQAQRTQSDLDQIRFCFRNVGYFDILKKELDDHGMNAVYRHMYVRTHRRKSQVYCSSIFSHIYLPKQTSPRTTSKSY